MGGIFKRLAKWIVRHGLDELQKEIDRKAADSQIMPRSTLPPDVQYPTRPPDSPRIQP